MKSAFDYAVVLVTAPDLKSARQLAETALKAKLAACVNLVPKVESHYWWKGKLTTSEEVMMVFKTTKTKVPGLERTILNHHPHETPEFLAISINTGTPKYLKWVSDSVDY